MSFDEAKIAGMPGVKKVVKVNDTAVAVVADTWWRAKKALDALPIVWDEGRQRQGLERDHRRAAQGGPRPRPTTNGDRNERRCAEGDRRARRRRSRRSTATPFLAHACMEPMNCHGASSRPTRPSAGCRRRTSRRRSRRCRRRPALPLAKCEVHRHDLGGGFGRRGGTQDYVRQAVAIAKEFPGVPVKLIWSREEDRRTTSTGRSRSASCPPASTTTASSPACTSASPASRSTPSLNPAAIADGKDMRQLQGYYAEPGDAQLGYTVPNLLIEYAMRNTHVPVGPVARRQHQPERRLPGVLHGRGGAARRARTRSSSAARSWRSIPSTSPCSTPRPRRATGASRCRPACIAASRSSWATAATRPPSPKSR